MLPTAIPASLRKIASPVPAAKHMIDCPRILDAQRSGHRAKEYAQSKCVSILSSDPFLFSPIRNWGAAMKLGPRCRARSRPWCWSRPRCRCRRRRRRRTWCSRAVSAASVQVVIAIKSAPDDHFARGPNRRIIVSCSRCVSGAGGCPTIRAGIVSAASVQIAEAAIRASAPDNHFAAGPHCGVKVSAIRRVDGAGPRPTVSAGIVSTASIKVAGIIGSAPDDHLAAGPHCRVIEAAVGRVASAGGYPSVRGRIVSAPGIIKPTQDYPTPDDHFATCPDRRVSRSGPGRVARAGGCPAVSGRIVSPAGV